MRQIFIEAIKTNRCVEIRYNGFIRVVEPHAIGCSRAGNDLLRAWKVRGGSVSNEPIGWKLFRLDEMHGGEPLEEVALCPRPGYRRDDRAMLTIYQQH